MNLGAIFVGLALLVLVIPFVITPFREKTLRKISPADSNGASPDGQRERVILAIHDLDFDYQTEKITVSDYTQVRTQLLAEAADIIQAEQQEDARTEEMIRAHREVVSPTKKCLVCGRHLFPDEDNFCPRCGVKLTAKCQSCGHSNRPDDKFCTNCGTQLIDRLEQE